MRDFKTATEILEVTYYKNNILFDETQNILFFVCVCVKQFCLQKRIANIAVNLDCVIQRDGERVSVTSSVITKSKQKNKK